jgi:hypothetical protein
MGKYVNPPNMSKEVFLGTYGLEISKFDFSGQSFDSLLANGQMVVVLVDNGAFKAALICYSADEYQYIIDNPDHRPKKYYIVDIASLQPYL